MSLGSIFEACVGQLFGLVDLIIGGLRLVGGHVGHDGRECVGWPLG